MFWGLAEVELSCGVCLPLEVIRSAAVGDSFSGLHALPL